MTKRSIVEKAVINIMTERVHDVAFEKAENDPEYRMAEIEKSKAFELLRGSLTSKQQKLLNDLDSAQNAAHGLMCEFAYRQGLMDSTMIRKELSDHLLWSN